MLVSPPPAVLGLLVCEERDGTRRSERKGEKDREGEREGGGRERKRSWREREKRERG